MFNPRQVICIDKQKWGCPCIHIDICTQDYSYIDLNRSILNRLTRWSPKLRKFDILSKYPISYLPVYPKHIKGTSLLNLQTMNSNRKDNKC